MMIAKAQRLHEEEQYSKDVTRMEQQTEVFLLTQPSHLQWSLLCHCCIYNYFPLVVVAAPNPYCLCISELM